MTTRKTTPEKAVEAKEVQVIKIKNDGAYDLVDPFTSVKYKANRVTETDEETNWLSCQIEAGLLVKVD